MNHFWGLLRVLRASACPRPLLFWRGLPDTKNYPFASFSFSRRFLSHTLALRGGGAVPPGEPTLHFADETAFGPATWVIEPGRSASRQRRAPLETIRTGASFAGLLKTRGEHPISRPAIPPQDRGVSTQTLLIIVLVVLLLGGGGFFYGRRR